MKTNSNSKQAHFDVQKNIQYNDKSNNNKRVTSAVIAHVEQ